MKETVASLFARAAEAIAENRAQQPTLGAEMRAEFRGGREDLWNAIIPAFPDSMKASREMGEPGSPTPYLTTQDLLGEPAHRDTDAPNTVAACTAVNRKSGAATPPWLTAVTAGWP